jgi:predicted MFS family arabinose efflux permease
LASANREDRVADHSNDADNPASLLTKTWYANYVLVLLTLGYVINTMDRSQILAAALQAIKKEFAASDFQMGMLTGVPFAVFYSVMGIPIAAWADRSSRRTVLALRSGAGAP